MGPPARRNPLGNTSRPSKGQYNSGGVARRTHVFRDAGNLSPAWVPLISSSTLDCIAFASPSALNLPVPVTTSVRHGLPPLSLENLVDAVGSFCGCYGGVVVCMRVC